MISVQEVILDTDMLPPEPYVILRSIGSFISGSFQSIVTPIQQFGPVQQASNKEIMMLPEADRVGSIRAFWSPVPIYLTRGTSPVPSVYGETPAGAVPGVTFTLSQLPPTVNVTVYVSGLLMTPNVDYLLSGVTLTLFASAAIAPWVQWPVMARVQQAASDIIEYPPGGEQFRILQRYWDPGNNVWKALGTRMNAA
jgi:hypothetical protein